MSSGTETLTPDDLHAAARHGCGHLDELLDRDWHAMVPGLEWDVRTTAEHLVDLLGFYTLHLAARTPSRLRIDVCCHDGLPNGEVVAIIRETASGLAELAAVTPPDVRAFHFHGITDASGFLALASAELLVHTHDILGALDATMRPPPDIAGKVCSRLFPDVPQDTPPWPTLLWATGRRSLPGYSDVGNGWVYDPTPLDA